MIRQLLRSQILDIASNFSMQVQGRLIKTPTIFTFDRVIIYFGTSKDFSMVKSKKQLVNYQANHSSSLKSIESQSIPNESTTLGGKEKEDNYKKLKRRKRRSDKRRRYKDVNQTKDVIKQQKTQENTNENRNQQQKSYGGLIWKILGGIFTVTAALIQNQKGIMLQVWQKFKQNQRKNQQRKNFEAVKQDMEKRYNRRFANIPGFEYIQTDRSNQITKIAEFDNNNIVQYVEGIQHKYLAFIGNSTATNLVSYINRKKNNSKVFFYDFSEPIQRQKNNGSQQGQAQGLNYLLTNLIQERNQKLNNQDYERPPDGKKKNEQILIINDVQFLSKCFQTLGINKLEELFKKIMYINQQKIAKVILISHNHYFFDDYLKKLQIVKLQNFRKVLLKQFREQDLKKIIQARVSYEHLIKMIPKEDKEKLDEIINLILAHTDSVNEAIRILRSIDIDGKSFFVNYARRHLFDDQESKLNCYLKAFYQQKFKHVSVDRTRQQCQYTIKVNISNILRSLGLKTYKDLNQVDEQSLKIKRDYKVQILNDVKNGAFKQQNAKSSLYLSLNNDKLQAFRELNNDDILHGFYFVSKSTLLAFKRLLKQNPRYFSVNLYWKTIRWLCD